MINTSESTVKISAALHLAQGACHAVTKSGTNNFHRYSYSTHEDFVKASREALSENELSLIFSVFRTESSKRTSGKEDCVSNCFLKSRLIHSSGEWMEIEVMGEGQDSGDKAPYKAYTGARKYATAFWLNLATTDDPENDANDRAPEQKKDQSAAKKSWGTKPVYIPAAPVLKVLSLSEVELKIKNAQNVTDLKEIGTHLPDSNFTAEQIEFVRGIYSIKLKELKGVD